MNVQTRMVWTLSASAFDAPSDELARRLGELGVDAVLTPFDAGRIEKYRALRRALDTQTPGRVALLFSLVGRRAFFLCADASLSLSANQELTLPFIVDARACLERALLPGMPSPCVVLSSPDMIAGVVDGERLVFGYGEAEAEVLEVRPEGEGRFLVRVRMVHGGALRPGLDVNAPLLPKGLFPLLPFDEAAMQGALREVADAIIVHGIAAEEEVHSVRKLLGERSERALEQSASSEVPPLLLFRVDSAVSLELVPRVLGMVDGVHLNRAELGMSIHLHDLPLVQKDLIGRCNSLGEIVIVSSDLMASMRRNPNPTRAEVSDVANLVVDGVDAVVLGREVSEGPFAREAARYAKEVFEDSETALTRTWEQVEIPQGSEVDAMAHAAVHTAEHVGARAIVCLTRTGYTAGRLSSLHAPIDVIAVTDSRRVMRQMSLMRGVRVLPLERKLAWDVFGEVRGLLTSQMGFSRGQRVVLVSLSTSPALAKESNLFVVEEL